MFTGIIQHVGRVLKVGTSPAGRRLTIDVGPLARRLARGSSLAVDGVCLTVAAPCGSAGLPAAAAQFDAVPQTLRQTTLADLTAGRAVNLEPAVSAGAPMDGHIVQGHIDGLARVVRIDRSRGGYVLHLTCPTELTDQMVPKGSIALAGVSLTLADVSAGRFSVALVPATLRATTLGGLGVSDRVNVEVDILGKYVRLHVAGLADRRGVTMEQLRKAGFA